MTDRDFSARLETLVREDAWTINILETVRSLDLSDWAIGAGFVRALVWDHISSQPRTRLDDIDVLYFDPDQLSQQQERYYEQALQEQRPDIPWSVKNQARMHLRNNNPPYENTEDAMRFWLETPTAVAVRLEKDGDLTLLAPFGLDDLFNLIIRPTPAGREKMDQFEERLRKKTWLSQWPDIRVIRD